MKLYLLLIFLFLNLVGYSQNNREGYIDSAEFHKQLGNSYQSLIFYKKALKESRKENVPEKIILDLIGVGDEHLSLNEMPESLESYIESLKIVDFNKCHDSLKIDVLLALGYYFLVYEDLDETERYLAQVYQIAKSNDNPEMYGDYYGQKGIVETRKKNYLESIVSYKKALTLVKGDNYRRQFDVLVSIATSYAYNLEYIESIDALFQAEAINANYINDSYFDIVICGQLGTVYHRMGKNEIALDYLTRGLELAEEKNHEEMIRRFNREMARMFYRQGEYQIAYRHYAAFVKQYEAYVAKQKLVVITEMNAKYQYEKKEQELVLLAEQKELEDQLNKEEISRQRTIIIYSSFAILLLIVIAAYIYRSQKKKQQVQRKLQEQEKELVEQKAILAGKDKERDRLSRELHDGLGGALASIKLRLSNQNEQESLSPILIDLDRACQEVRNVSHSLSSSYIQASDFYSLLKKFTDDLQGRSGMKIQFDFLPKDELNKLSESLRHNCFRIIQELSNNALKHSKATHFTIGLLLDDNDVLLLIEDNGVGCDLTQNKLKGIGLQNIRGRVKNINGELEIDSQIGKGMTFSIKFPYCN